MVWWIFVTDFVWGVKIAKWQDIPEDLEVVVVMWGVHSGFDVTHNFGMLGWVIFNSCVSEVRWGFC